MSVLQGNFLVRRGPYHGGGVTALTATRGPPSSQLLVTAGADYRIAAIDWTRNAVTDLGSVAGKDKDGAAGTNAVYGGATMPEDNSC